ncbi:sigma-70 family RNA polymerase sigma factor [Roseiarcaceae bacterium H3SJ34-1]|uniref:sigma-70 family RNA polymerase sigma factor n=1 Tax=Terripilifer ovatus TaxID=3032367 RepID=UPI003AB97EF5|nr:sigma-70 family RNA polymerase sigma factor [Roseiarcaceae bacterium H3SJ34-1]
MNGSAVADTGRDAFDRMLTSIRPKLHRYCARMTGSVIDGEDIVQDTLIKALEAFPTTGPIANVEGWLFRIAHNTTLDFLRRRARLAQVQSDEDMQMIADPSSAADNHAIVSTSLRTFMRLPPAQRSSVILMDVLGYSLEDMHDVMNTSIPSIKAALHRGRERLRTLADEPDDAPVPTLADDERRRLATYIERFNARDVDTLRTMLAEDVHLDLVAYRRIEGKPGVSNYFGNYAKVDDWRLTPGLVEGRAAALVSDPRDASATPIYFILLDWNGDGLIHIRDFRYAQYAMEGAAFVRF